MFLFCDGKQLSSHREFKPLSCFDKSCTGGQRKGGVKGKGKGSVKGQKRETVNESEGVKRRRQEKGVCRQQQTSVSLRGVFN